jgi:hypothetical protein
MITSHTSLTQTRLFSSRSRLNSCWRRCFLTLRCTATAFDKYGWRLVMLIDAAMVVAWLLVLL